MSIVNRLSPQLKHKLLSMQNSYWKIAYKGKVYECPICQHSVKEFARYGVKRRKNARCPYCQSLERHRLQWLFMKDKTNIEAKDLSVLHFAPEQSLKSKLQSMPNIKYLSCDLYDPNVMMKVDITNMPFKDNSFDVVLCNHVLEHIIDDIRAMKELYRVLKKGGWAILQVPIDYSRSKTYEDPTIVSPEDRLKHFEQRDHVRIYGTDYEQRLKSIGWKVSKIDYAKTFPGKLIHKYVLDPKELIYYCQK